MRWRLSCLSSAGFLLPEVESIGPDFVVGTGCKSMSAGMEVAVNEGVGGEEVLDLPR